MDVITIVTTLALLSLAPFLLMLTTSFVKFTVVMSLIRSALGTQQIPPNPVILGLSVALTIHVMAPVITDMHQIWARHPGGSVMVTGTPDPHRLLERLLDTSTPLRRFLLRHAHSRDVVMFESFSAANMSRSVREPEACSYDVLIPAFVLSELKESFEIGFLIFLPFVMVDMIVANVLQAMGMMMLSPTTISLPFKLLLFVLSDGWHVLVESLLRGYML